MNTQQYLDLHNHRVQWLWGRTRQMKLLPQGSHTAAYIYDLDKGCPTARSPVQTQLSVDLMLTAINSHTWHYTCWVHGTGRGCAHTRCTECQSSTRLCCTRRRGCVRRCERCVDQLINLRMGELTGLDMRIFRIRHGVAHMRVFSDHTAIEYIYDWEKRRPFRLSSLSMQLPQTLLTLLAEQRARHFTCSLHGRTNLAVTFSMCERCGQPAHACCSIYNSGPVVCLREWCMSRPDSPRIA